MPDPEAFIMAEEEEAVVDVGGSDNNPEIQLQPQRISEEPNDTTIAAAQEEEEEPVVKCAKEEATEEGEEEDSKFCAEDAAVEAAEAVAEAVANETIDVVAGATGFHHSKEAEEMVVEAAAETTTTTEPQNSTTTQAPSASAEDEADNDCSTNEQPPDSNNNTVPVTTTTLPQPQQHPASHMSIVERERDALRQANAALRREIAQRDTLEEQMENELNQLSKVVEQQWHKICHLEAALTKERAIRDRTQASLVKAKHQHKELRKNIKKRKRAAFAAMAEAHESDLIATTLPIGDLETPPTQEGVATQHPETEPAAQHTGQEGDADGDANTGEPGQSKKTKTSKHHDHPLIGQTWDGRDSKHDLKWMHMLEELKRFKQEFGHVNVPAKWKGSDPRWNKLACWCSTQRTQHKLLRLGKWTNLKPERVRQLQALGFKWNGQHNPNTIAMSFDDRVLQLQDYKQTHGDCNVPQKYEELPGLGNFVLQQRKYYRLGTLSAERIQILERIGFQWSLRNRGGSLEARMMKHSQSNTNTMDPTYGLPEPEMVEQPQHHENVNDAHDDLDPHPHHAHHHPLPHEEDEPPHDAAAGVTATATEEDPVPHHHPAAPHQWTELMHALPRFPPQQPHPLWTTEAPPVSPPRMAPQQQPWMATATTTAAAAPDYAPYNMYNG